MTTSLQRHLLLKLSKAQTLGEKGFTLVELLVVIIIIGILAAVALPSLLAQTDKARASEAKSTLGAISRAEQAHYMDKKAFTTGISTDLGIASKTENFEYAAGGTTSPVTITATGVAGSKADGIECTLKLEAPPPDDPSAGFKTGQDDPQCTKGTTNL